VVAEGVETSEQARLLRLLKCDQAQGYLIAKPMPADDVVKMLAARVDFSPPSRA
jgi:EAL domain-containing protein (putative c-di-GMP-specific phosphodiesterase class I)